MPAPQSDMVVIDNDLIQTLMRDPVVAQRIGCLKNPPIRGNPRAGCGNCNDQRPDYDYVALRTCIALLDSSTLQFLKNYLNTRQIRIFRPNEARTHIIKHTR